MLIFCYVFRNKLCIICIIFREVTEEVGIIRMYTLLIVLNANIFRRTGFENFHTAQNMNSNLENNSVFNRTSRLFLRSLHVVISNVLSKPTVREITYIFLNYIPIIHVFIISSQFLSVSFTCVFCRCPNTT